MMRTIILALSAATFIALVALGWLVYRASPGPDNQDILGVTLGKSDNETGLAFISGRRIECVPEADAPYTSTCTMTIAGQLLTIQAFRNGPEQPNQVGGGCQAVYAGQTWPCAISSRHVDVHWFAHISDPLGLDAAQLTTLRQQYFMENLPEEPFLTGMLVAPVLAALAVLAGWWAWKRPSTWRGWGTAVGLSMVSLIGVFVLAIKLTRGFWD
ncbi:MAG: hypothetical protein IPM39_28940 [Chloroflexi bacterium]|nr:hypothetical protein [Chloroflexota bacterium]